MSRSHFAFFSVLTLSLMAARASFAGIDFAGGQLVPVATKPDFMLVGDLNKDGFDDVVVIASKSNEVDIYLGVQADPLSPSPNFTPGGAMHFGQKLAGAALGDLNGDGILDIAVVDSSDASVWVLLGHGDGTFLTPYEASVGGSKKPVAVAIGNFDTTNNSGYNDLAVADSSFGRIFILRNDNGAPPRFLAGGNKTVGLAPSDIRAVDLNNDGHLDLVVLNLGGPRVKEVDTILWTGVTQGFPVFADPQRFTIGASPSSMVVADFNNDTYPDVATLNQPAGGVGGSEIDVLLNDKHGGLSLPEAIPLPCPFATGGAQCRGLQLAAGDFDGNGTIDLVATLTDPRHSSVSDAMQAFGGRGDGGFFPGGVFVAQKAPQSIAVGDINGDGKLDVAVANATLNLQAFLNVSTAGILGDGESCLTDDVCLSNRCGDGVCCAAQCDLANNEKCNVPRREGDCVAVPPSGTARTCTISNSTCICADGFCCDEQCPTGHCNVDMFQGVCIPGLASGQPCPSGNNDDCASGFCSGNYVCCNSACLDGSCDDLGICHPLTGNGGTCSVGTDCQSGICDTNNPDPNTGAGICCASQCDPASEICFPDQGICRPDSYTPGVGTPGFKTATPTPSPTPRSTPVGSGETCSVPGDCLNGICITGVCCQTQCSSTEQCQIGTGVCFAVTPTDTPTIPPTDTPAPTALPTQPTVNPCGGCPSGTRCVSGLCIGSSGGGGCSTATDEPARGNAAMAAFLPLALWAGRRWQLRRARVRVRGRAPRQ